MVDGGDVKSEIYHYSPLIDINVMGEFDVFRQLNKNLGENINMIDKKTINPIV